MYYTELIVDDLGWASSLSSLRHLDLSGRDNHWFHPLNMLPSLLTLNLVWFDIDIPSIKLVNFTSLNSLDLSLNDINSRVPVWLSNLTGQGLVHLNLHLNDFHADCIGMLSSLASIDISL
ncbi:putative leucine-rich repeat domain superfamily [Helianthus annuus]|nr:putative leucine-rich repeat domain superfamily [Helianthus annuus]